MSRPCSICVLPEKERLVIDRKIVRGVPLSQIARESGFDRQVVERHKPHVHRQLLQVTEKNKIVASSFLLGEVNEIISKVKSLMETAEKAGQTGVALIATREWRETLKYVTSMAIDLKRLELEEKQVNTPRVINVTLVDDDDNEIDTSKLPPVKREMPVHRRSLPEPEPVIDVEPAIEPVQKRFRRKGIKDNPEPEPDRKGKSTDEFEKMRRRFIKPDKVPDEAPTFTDAELDEIDSEGMTMRERLEIRPLFERAH